MTRQLRFAIAFAFVSGVNIGLFWPSKGDSVGVFIGAAFFAIVAIACLFYCHVQLEWIQQWLNEVDRATYDAIQWKERAKLRARKYNRAAGELSEMRGRIAELESELARVHAFFRTPHGEWLYGDDNTPLYDRVQGLFFEMDARED